MLLRSSIGFGDYGSLSSLQLKGWPCPKTAGMFPVMWLLSVHDLLVPDVFEYAARL